MDHGKWLLVIPTKKTYEVDVVTPLVNLFSSSYSNSADQLKELSESAAAFCKLRSESVVNALEQNETSLKLLCNYYDQLDALVSKISAEELQVPFKYKDAFSKGSMFVSRRSLTLSSLGYEKVCVLFNIAALQSAVAQNQNCDSDDGLQNAVKHFQQAAGVLSYLSSEARASIHVELTPDLSTDCLNILTNLMLAQAQEAFLAKVIRDNGKDLLIAKICSQCESLYGDIANAMNRESMRTLFDRDWLSIVVGKEVGYQAMLQFYMSLHNRKAKQIGHEISRLQKAIDLFQAAQTRSGKRMFEEFEAKAQRNLRESRKDNDFIYNASIPNIKDLESPGKLMVAKKSLMVSPLNKEFRDIFHNLDPLHLYQAIVTAEARSKEAVNAELMKLRDATQALNETLAGLNLPAAIEEPVKGTSLPQSLIDKANQVKSLGGVTMLQSNMNELPGALVRNQEILDEIEKMLNEEESVDLQLREQFQEKWRTVPSKTLTQNFRLRLQTYRDLLNTAITADKNVQDKFQKNLNGMQVLSSANQDLHGAVPFAAAIKTSPTTEKLKNLMKVVQDLKTNRTAIEHDLNATQFNLKAKLKQALDTDGVVNEPSISAAEIENVVGPIKKRVQASLSLEKDVLSEIVPLHKQFITERGGGTNQRDTLLKELALAYDAFTELSNSVTEGTKFYKELTELLIVYQNQISDFCFARKIEKDELAKDMPAAAAIRKMLPVDLSTLAQNLPPSISAIATSVLANTNSTTAPAPASNLPYPTEVNMPVPYGTAAETPYPSTTPSYPLVLPRFLQNILPQWSKTQEQQPPQ